MIIKSVIRYDNGIAIEATWVDDDDNPVRCHVYDGSQMGDLRADLGSVSQEQEELIAQCESDWANQPPPAPLPPPVYSCSPWQIRKALNAQGLRQQVEDAVTQSTDQTLKDGWQFATEFRSDDPFVITMGAALGMDAEQVGNLIQWASTL